MTKGMIRGSAILAVLVAGVLVAAPAAKAQCYGTSVYVGGYSGGYAYPQPVYVAPPVYSAPVYAPQVVYSQPVVYSAPPVVYSAPVVYSQPYYYPYRSFSFGLSIGGGHHYGHGGWYRGGWGGGYRGGYHGGHGGHGGRHH
jgi:hypothetical protein